MHFKSNNYMLLIGLSLATCVPAETLSMRKDRNILGYITSNALTTVALIFYLIVAVLHTWCMARWKAKWMLAMVIAVYTYSIGIAMRYALHYNPDSLMIYIVQNLFVVLSPCGFIAAEYIILGRLARYIEADGCLIISPRRITVVFVSSDIATFLIQGSGGGLSASADGSMRNLGSKIFLAGLIGQLISFGLFMAVFAIFLLRVRRDRPLVWMKDSQKHWSQSWLVFSAAIGLSCIGILIRSFFRTVEASQGFGGQLATSEGFFYALDVLPLLVTVSLFVPFWPGRFIPAFSPTPIQVPQSDMELDRMLSDRNKRMDDRRA